MNQPHTFQGLRGETEVKGITFKQIYDIVYKKLEYYNPETCDPHAFCQDVCCRIEKLMGIFPNLGELAKEITDETRP